MSPEEREQVRAWVRETRARQGLPPTVENEGVLAEFARAVTEERSDDEPAPKEAS